MFNTRLLAARKSYELSERSRRWHDLKQYISDCTFLVLHQSAVRWVAKSFALLANSKSRRAKRTAGIQAPGLLTSRLT